jgi:hypothetical protein
MNAHIFILYLIAGAALSIAIGASFGQRSDYLRLNMLGAPQLTLGELFVPPPIDDRAHCSPSSYDPYLTVCNMPGVITFDTRWRGH